MCQDGPLLPPAAPRLSEAKSPNAGLGYQPMVARFPHIEAAHSGSLANEPRRPPLIPPPQPMEACQPYLLIRGWLAIAPSFPLQLSPGAIHVYVTSSASHFLRPRPRRLLLRQSLPFSSRTDEPRPSSNLDPALSPLVRPPASTPLCRPLLSSPRPDEPLIVLIAVPTPLRPACSSMEPSSKKRKLAPKVDASSAPNSQPSQYVHETVSLAPLARCLFCRLSSLPVLQLIHVRFFSLSHSLNSNPSSSNRNSSRRRRPLRPMPSTMPPLLSATTSSRLPATSRMPPCSFSAKLNDHHTRTYPCFW